VKGYSILARFRFEWHKRFAHVHVRVYIADELIGRLRLLPQDWAMMQTQLGKANMFDVIRLR
jgi:hypothetical protein